MDLYQTTAIDQYDKDFVAKRLRLESSYIATAIHTPSGVRWLQVLERTLAFLAKISLLYAFGRQHALNIKLISNNFRIKDLPKALDGLRILHLSDLHLDRDARITERLIKKLEGLDYDLAVLTGDYRSRTLNSETIAIQRMHTLIPYIKAPIFAILGNHDNLDMAPKLEAMGVQVLINQSACWAYQGTNLYLVGVDDPHHFKLDNLKQACSHIPLGAFTILLSHAPEHLRQAAQEGIQIMLCGHTHGGQACTPWGSPIQLNFKRKQRTYFSGRWKHLSMQGYTSRGVGCCGVPIRFFCSPEITIHTLQKASG